MQRIALTIEPIDGGGVAIGLADFTGAMPAELLASILARAAEARTLTENAVAASRIGSPAIPAPNPQSPPMTDVDHQIAALRDRIAELEATRSGGPCDRIAGRAAQEFRLPGVSSLPGYAQIVLDDGRVGRGTELFIWIEVSALARKYVSAGGFWVEIHLGDPAGERWWLRFSHRFNAVNRAAFAVAEVRRASDSEPLPPGLWLTPARPRR